MDRRNTRETIFFANLAFFSFRQSHVVHPYNTWSHAGHRLTQIAFVSALVSAVRGSTGLCASDNGRPDGVTLIPWRHGKCLVGDFTCSETANVSSIAPVGDSHESRRGGKLGGGGENYKINELVVQLAPMEIEMAPIVIETLGV